MNLPPPDWPDYFSLLLDLEGEAYEHDPRDPGGATKFGIDQRSHPTVNIRNLTRQDAEKIYLAEYYRSAAHWLPQPLDYLYFDHAINAGETAAARILQQILGVTIDGKVGPFTIGAIKNRLDRQPKNLPFLLRLYSENRILFYQRLAYSKPRLACYLKGWLNRTRRAHTWATAHLPEAA